MKLYSAEINPQRFLLIICYTKINFYFMILHMRGLFGFCEASVIYCISARKKIEIYDINTLKALHNSAGQQIHIILTHCDGVDEDILQEREQYLRDEISKNLYIYRIVSINKTKRNGAIISKSGREAVLSGVFDLLWNDVAENVSETISNIFYSEMSAEINRFKNKLNAFIDKNLNVFSLGKMLINEESDKMDAELDALIDNYSNIFDEFQNRLEQESVRYIEPLVKLYNSYSKIAEYKELVNAEEIIDACFEIVANAIEPFNDMDIEELVMNNFEIAKSVNNIDDVDDGSVKEIIKAIFSAGKGVLSIKNDAKRLVLKAETYLYDTIKREDLRDTIYKAIVNR